MTLRTTRGSSMRTPSRSTRSLRGSVAGRRRRAGFGGRWVAADMETAAGPGLGTHGVDDDAQEDKCVGRALAVKMLMEEEQGTSRTTFLISGPHEPQPGEAARGLHLFSCVSSFIIR